MIIINRNFLLQKLFVIYDRTYCKINYKQPWQISQKSPEHRFKQIQPNSQSLWLTFHYLLILMKFVDLWLTRHDQGCHFDEGTKNNISFSYREFVIMRESMSALGLHLKRIIYHWFFSSAPLNQLIIMSFPVACKAGNCNLLPTTSSCMFGPWSSTFGMSSLI